MPDIESPLSDWLAWLETLSPTEINLGLERVELMLDRLALPQPQHLFIIAGTNGKGSSVAMTEALLRACGLRVGAYTSPHILKYNERIRVAGELANDADIVAAFARIEALRGDVELTYFEFGTLAAAVIFAAADLDAWVLEVGLGGRLDASNAFLPSASLITNVALDHCEWLGHDVETIAVEKAGIMRAGVATVFGAIHVPESLFTVANESGADLLLRDRDYKIATGASGNWQFQSSMLQLQDLDPPGLLGEFQIGNAAAVLAMLCAAGFAHKLTTSLVNSVLPGLSVAGRAQKLEWAGRTWLIDVAHNPAASAELAHTLRQFTCDAKLVAIIGILDDKDVDGIIAPLAEWVDCWIAMTPNSRRAIRAAELAPRIADQTGSACLVAASPQEAVEIARRTAAEDDKILVTGSFFTVGPVLELLTHESQPES